MVTSFKKRSTVDNVNQLITIHVNTNYQRLLSNTTVDQWAPTVYLTLLQRHTPPPNVPAFGQTFSKNSHQRERLQPRLGSAMLNTVVTPRSRQTNGHDSLLNTVPPLAHTLHSTRAPTGLIREVGVRADRCLPCVEHTDCNDPLSYCINKVPCKNKACHQVKALNASSI